MPSSTEPVLHQHCWNAHDFHTILHWKSQGIPFQFLQNTNKSFNNLCTYQCGLWLCGIATSRTTYVISYVKQCIRSRTMRFPISNFERHWYVSPNDNLVVNEWYTPWELVPEKHQDLLHILPAPDSSTLLQLCGVAWRTNECSREGDSKNKGVKGAVNF